MRGRGDERGQATVGLLGQAAGLETMSKGLHIRIPPVTRRLESNSKEVQKRSQVLSVSFRTQPRRSPAMHRALIEHL